MSLRRSVAALALVATAIPAPYAAAHNADPNVLARLDAVRPELPGVTVEIRTGVADQLLLVNTTPTPVEVLDTNGVPFLRIARDHVEANLASADWYRSNSPLGLAKVPAVAVTTWRVVANAGSWGWFDHRLHPTARMPTESQRRSRIPVRLADWTVPLRYGATNVTVSGHVEYRPVQGRLHSVVGREPAGVVADVLDGRVPGLFVHWNGAGTLTVRGVGGEPFARFDRTHVEVNEASETWQEDQRLRGTAPAVAADPAKPRWRRVGAQPTLAWLDRRLAYAPGVPPADVLGARHPTTMVEWTLPVDVDGRPDRIAGTTLWQPADRAESHRSFRPWWLLPLLGVLVLVRVVVRRVTKPPAR